MKPLKKMKRERERERTTHTNVWWGTSKTPFQRSKGAISELPFCYLPPMNQIITKKWTLSGIMKAKAGR